MSMMSLLLIQDTDVLTNLNLSSSVRVFDDCFFLVRNFLSLIKIFVIFYIVYQFKSCELFEWQ